MTTGPSFLFKDCSGIFAKLLSVLFNSTLREHYPIYGDYKMCTILKKYDKSCIVND